MIDFFLHLLLLVPVSLAILFMLWVVTSLEREIRRRRRAQRGAERAADEPMDSQPADRIAWPRS